MNPFAEPARRCHRSRRAWPPSVRAVVAIGATAALASLATACGGSPASRVGQLASTTTTPQSSAAPASTAQSAHEDAALAFSRCMRSHGVPSFPDPDPQGNVPPFQAGVSKQTSTAASEACKHLLATGGGDGLVTRGDRQKLTFALKVARCIRSHGFPAYPDPATSSQGSGTRFAGTGIDPKSPQFQTKETSCEKHERKALGLP